MFTLTACTCEYVNKVAAGERRWQNGAINFNAETDRVYVNTETECVIVDNRLKRKIHVAKSGGQSTVVCPPGREKRKNLATLALTAGAPWCVESANALDSMVQVPAGAKHAMAVEYWVEGF
jgi:glucose-6-phosphate 1-epimerase